MSLPNRSRQTFIMVFTCFMFLALGCSPSPKVKYYLIKGGDLEGLTKFNFVGSNILVSKKTDDITKSLKDQSIGLTDVNATVIPAQTSNLYAIVPQSQWLGLVNTRLQVTYYDGSRNIKELGTEVIDNRAKAVETMAELAKFAIALLDAPLPATFPATAPLPPTPASLRVPFVIKADSINTPDWHPVPKNQFWVARLVRDNATMDKDSVDLGVFLDEFTETGWFNSTSVFPISACQKADLEISPILPASFDKLGLPPNPTYDEWEKWVLTTSKAETIDSASIKQEILKKHLGDGLIVRGLQITTPERVRTVEMPDKGKVVTHQLCGADIKAEGSAGTINTEILTTIMKQAQSVYETQKKKKEDSKKDNK